MTPAVAQAPTKPPEIQLETKDEMIQYATRQALNANVDPTQVVGTIECESSWNPDAVGDGGTSFGLSQIHLPAHPHIEEEKALDPKYAINFMIDEFEAGRSYKWTCWRKLYGHS